jgi:hypothetical protein
MTIKPKDRKAIEQFHAYLTRQSDARDVMFLARLDIEMAALSEAFQKIRHGLSVKTEWPDPKTYSCEIVQTLRKGGAVIPVLSLMFNRVADGHLHIEANVHSKDERWEKDIHLTGKGDCSRLHMSIAETVWDSLSGRDQLALNALISRPDEPDEEDAGHLHTDWKEEGMDDHVRAGEISRQDANKMIANGAHRHPAYH